MNKHSIWKWIIMNTQRMHGVVHLILLQNDAVMYGLLLAYRPQKANNRFSVDACLGGYVGWEGDGDCPMTLKTNVSWRVGDVWLRVGHQVGLIDWPYHQIRLGVSYSFDILNTQRRGVK